MTFSAAVIYRLSVQVVYFVNRVLGTLFVFRVPGVLRVMEPRDETSLHDCVSRVTILVDSSECIFCQQSVRNPVCFQGSCCCHALISPRAYIENKEYLY
jgi:hypothetical protein